MVRKLRKRLRITPLTTRVHDLVADGEMDGTTGNVPLFSVFTRGNLRRLVSVRLKNGRSHDLCAIPDAYMRRQCTKSTLSESQVRIYGLVDQAL